MIVEYETGEFFLYDFDADIAEANDIAAANPTILESMKIKLRDHLKAVDAHMPTLDSSHPNFNGTAPDLDEDDLDDTWEITELLSYSLGRDDDPDGDGLDNYTEMMNGTDPLMSNTVLAVLETMNFQVAYFDLDKVQLSWLIPTNNTISQFEIQRYEHNEWIKIGSASNSQNQFIDQNPNMGYNYYRLQIANEDGTIDHSLPVHINLSSIGKVVISPNPAQDEFQIQFDHQTHNFLEMSLAIYAANGQRVKSLDRMETYSQRIEISDFEKGIYFIEILKDNHRVEMKRLVVQ